MHISIPCFKFVEARSQLDRSVPFNFALNKSDPNNDESFKDILFATIPLMLFMFNVDLYYIENFEPGNFEFDNSESYIKSLNLDRIYSWFNYTSYYFSIKITFYRFY